MLLLWFNPFRKKVRMVRTPPALHRRSFMKNVHSGLFAFLFALVLSACGGGDDPPAPVVVVLTATVSNVSPATFSKVGYGEMSGFDLACPADSGGCKITHLRELLTAPVSTGTDIDTFVGSAWWYGLQTTAPNANGYEAFNLTSPTTIPAGITVRISARSKLTAGKLEFDSLELIAVKDGKPITLAGPLCKDSVVTMCKG